MSARKRKLTVGEQLAKLVDPTPSSESADVLDFSPPQPRTDEVSSDDELAELIYEATEAGADRLTGRSQLQRQAHDIDLGEAYAGKVVSRRQLEQASGSESESETGGSDSDSDSDSESDSDADAEVQKKRKRKKPAVDPLQAALYRQLAQLEEEDSEGSDESSEESEEEETGVQVKRRRERVQQDGAAMFREGAVEREQRKAADVRQQKALWESSLNLRIRMQSALNLANRMPSGPIFEAFVNQPADSDDGEGAGAVREAFSEVQLELGGLLGDLLELESSLYQSHPHLEDQPVFDRDAVEAASGLSGMTNSSRPSTKKKSKKRLAEEESAEVELLRDPSPYWKYMDASQEAFAAYRDAVVDRWNRKTQLAAGSGASSSFKSLNQSVLSQIRTILEDEQRLVRRTQLVRTPCSVFGEEVVGEGLQDVAKKQKEKEHNAEIFDDLDFYQHLLRAIISSGAGQGLDADEELSAALRATRKHTKKKVDRRASKGRKIRYVPQPKLINFMAPISRVDEDFARDQLFASLFGQRGQKRKGADSL